MNDSQAILPISASADGRLNMYFSQCHVTSQVVNYAACLWRQGVLSNPATKTPADWAQCGEAGKCGRCMALEMRKEEVLQGKAIYFRGRSSGLTIKQEAMATYEEKYGHPPESIPAPKTGVVLLGSGKRKSSPPPAMPVIPKAPVVKRSTSILDVMGGESDYAAAINAAVVAAPQPSKPVAVAAPRIEPSPPPAAKPVGPAVALPGESPLAMARRLAAQRQAAST